MADDLKSLRDRLIQNCEGYDANDVIRAMTSALTTIIIGATRDWAAADRGRRYGQGRDVNLGRRSRLGG
jgi:hypothetical protein